MEGLPGQPENALCFCGGGRTVREPAAAAEHTKISPMKRSEQEAAITQVEEKIREKASPKSKFAELTQRSTEGGDPGIFDLIPDSGFAKLKAEL